MKLRLPALCLAAIFSLSIGVLPQALAQNGAGSSIGTRATPIAQIKDWFNKYDAIRRQAQMNPQQRAKADAMLSKGLAIVMPGPDKQESAGLFQLLEQKNANADTQLKNLPLYPETEQLHRGYHQYFHDTASLFADYLQVQNNLMTPDPATGKPLMTSLLGRKKMLEELDFNNKNLDADLRNRFRIAPYQY
jgi:hypothetical protein